MPQLPDLRIADPARDVVEERVAVDDLALVDLAMRRPGADPELVVGLDDAVQPGHVSDVDEERRLRQAELQERQQAVPAREDLGVALMVGQRPEDAVQVRWPDVLEGCGNHARPSSSTPTSGAFTVPPSSPWAIGLPDVDDRAGGWLRGRPLCARSVRGPLPGVRNAVEHPTFKRFRRESLDSLGHIPRADKPTDGDVDFRPEPFVVLTDRRRPERAAERIEEVVPWAPRSCTSRSAGKDGAALQSFYEDIFGWDLDKNNPGG